MSFSWQATWADIKQLGWVVLLLWAFVGVLGILSSDYFGTYTLPVVLGLATLVTTVLVLVALVSILASLVDDLLHWVWRRGG